MFFTDFNFKKNQEMSLMGQGTDYYFGNVLDYCFQGYSQIVRGK